MAATIDNSNTLRDKNVPNSDIESYQGALDASQVTENTAIDENNMYSDIKSLQETTGAVSDSDRRTATEYGAQQEGAELSQPNANDVFASGFIQSFASASVGDNDTDSGLYYDREWPSKDESSSTSVGNTTNGKSQSNVGKEQQRSSVAPTSQSPPKRPATEASYSHSTHVNAAHYTDQDQDMQCKATAGVSIRSPMGIFISSDSSASDLHGVSKTKDALNPHACTVSEMGSLSSDRAGSADSNLHLGEMFSPSSNAKESDGKTKPILVRDGSASMSKLVESVINKDGYLATTRSPQASPLVISSEGNTNDGTDHGAYQPSASSVHKRFPSRKPTIPYSVSLPRMSDGLQEITLHRRATGDRFGLTLSKVAHCLYVVCVRPGFLAYQAGMRFGDQITSINGVDTFDLDVRAATDLINGGPLPVAPVCAIPPITSATGTAKNGNTGISTGKDGNTTDGTVSRKHSTDGVQGGGRLDRKQSQGVNVLMFSSKPSDAKDQTQIAPPQLRGMALPEKSGYQYFSRNNTSQMNLGPSPRATVASTEPTPTHSASTSPRSAPPTIVKAPSVKYVKCVLGVHFQPDVRTCTVPLYKTTDIGISVRKGCVIKVLPGSPAATSGIMKGDVIIDVNGYCAIGKRRHEIYHMISTNDPGTIVMIQVMAESKFGILTTVMDPKLLGKLMSY
ncbi:hypothetical protein SARC_06379 [Sphaeroforma arctica JP610]|uniref:PDZ domain-containing protein n=1 Tax=Sphaeroforma arctica JP610 TaxID=667725 RepID=A0A0L0FXB5_9EUKA|nr:hypothetical protein SARC_06379 [Sphaeroforma arctica JP610]KNC81289.1 hypothetical protein SARC_06379 [Sphaeroforma arctica JP610]|eukprot:XP_014155191.1 hypothetical protein SARC_06379 [Sphaeroforma arctica JP610]